MTGFFRTAKRACHSVAFYDSVILDRKSTSKSSAPEKKDGRYNPIAYFVTLLAFATVIKMLIASAYINPLALSAVDHRAALDRVDESFPEDLVINIEGESYLDGTDGQSYSRITANQETPYAIRSTSAALFLSEMMYASPIIVEYIKAKYPGMEAPARGSDAWNEELDNIPALITFEKVPAGLAKSLNISTEHPSVFSDGPEFENLSQFCHIYNSVVVVIEYGYLLCPHILDHKFQDSIYGEGVKTPGEEVVDVPVYNAENGTDAGGPQMVQVHDPIGALIFYPFHNLDSMIIDKESVGEWTESVRKNTLLNVALDAKIIVGAVGVFAIMFANAALTWSLNLVCLFIANFATTMGFTKYRRVPAFSFDDVFNTSTFGLTPAVLLAPACGDISAMLGAFAWCTYITYKCTNEKVQKKKK